MRHAPLVVVEAPAGCDKTHQGDVVSASRNDRLLILTHTLAACSVFADRTKSGMGSLALVDGRRLGLAE